MNKSPKGFAQSALRPAEESRAIDTHCGRQPDKHVAAVAKVRLDRPAALLSIEPCLSGLDTQTQNADSDL